MKMKKMTMKLTVVVFTAKHILCMSLAVPFHAQVLCVVLEICSEALEAQLLLEKIVSPALSQSIFEECLQRVQHQLG